MGNLDSLAVLSSGVDSVVFDSFEGFMKSDWAPQAPNILCIQAWEHGGAALQHTDGCQSLHTHLHGMEVQTSPAWCRKTQPAAGTQVRNRLTAAGLGPTQVDADMDDPIEDSPAASDDYVPPARMAGPYRGRVRGRNATGEASTDDENEGRLKKRGGNGGGRRR